MPTCITNKHGSSQVIKNIQKHAVIMEPLLDSSGPLFQRYFFSHLWVPTAYGWPASRVPSFKGYGWLQCPSFKGMFCFPLSRASQGYVLLPSFKGFPLPRVCVVLQVAVLFPLFSSASLARKASTASAKVAHGPSALPWFLNHMWSSHFVLMG